jgi:hypothetical protein
MTMDLRAALAATPKEPAQQGEPLIDPAALFVCPQMGANVTGVRAGHADRAAEPAQQVDGTPEQQAFCDSHCCWSGHHADCFRADRAAAPMPPWIPIRGGLDMGMAAPTPAQLRQWADHPASNRYVPVHPNTLRRLADAIEQAQEAYTNMRAWAEQNGLDTATYGDKGADRAAAPMPSDALAHLEWLHHFLKTSPAAWREWRDHYAAVRAALVASSPAAGGAPLSEEKIDELAEWHGLDQFAYEPFARAIEAAHGISDAGQQSEQA